MCYTKGEENRLSLSAEDSEVLYDEVVWNQRKERRSSGRQYQGSRARTMRASWRGWDQRGLLINESRSRRTEYVQELPNGHFRE